MNHTPVPADVDVLRKRWQRLQWLWYFLHYFFGSVGVGAGVLASTKGVAGLDASLCGAIAGLAAGFITFLTPITMAKRYQLAFHIADQACLDHDAGTLDRKELAEIVSRARKISVGAPPENHG